MDERLATEPGKGHVVSIGGVGISMASSSDNVALALPEAHEAFLDSSASVDIHLEVTDEPIPEGLSKDRQLFEADSTWRLLRRPEGYALALVSPAFGPEPYRVALLNDNWTAGRLHVRLPAPEGDADSTEGPVVVCPWMSPLDELLVANRLAEDQGILVHACGIREGDAGFLFIGDSGAGKSTTARLWDERGAEVLSDERVIVRREGGGFRIYGSPWHSSARAASASFAPLRAVFILRHGAGNSLRAMSRIEVVTRVIRCAYPTYYHKDGMESATRILSDLSRVVPAYEFSFVPDASSIDFVLDEMGVRA